MGYGKFRLGSCKACNGKVSTLAPRCPHCGIANPAMELNYRKRIRNKFVATVTGSLAFLLIYFGPATIEALGIIAFLFIITIILLIINKFLPKK